MNEYDTLDKTVTVEFEEKKSVFLGHAAPVRSEEEALAFIRQKKEEYADARHNVYAYLLSGGAIARCSDDGEPQGTAGVILLDVLKKNGVTDAVLVVTRYFGGILLGAGGLIRAYSTAAKTAVAESGKAHYEEYTDFSLVCAYGDYQKLKKEFEKRGILETGAEFGAEIVLSLSVKSRDYAPLPTFFSEMSAGRLVLTPTGTHFGKG